jgi:hypothetical protein
MIFRKNPKATTLLVMIILSVLISGCSDGNKDKGSPEYISQIKQWRTQRIEGLKKANGWLNLAGLFWLKQGENTFGTNPGNDIVFPKGKAPGTIGMFILKDSTVTFKVAPGVNVTSGGKKVKEMQLMDDMSGNPTILDLGFLRWFVIKRGDKYGIRLRNLDADLVKEFNGTEVYPIDEDWKFNATFVKYDPPKIISIPTIVGTVEEDTCPGALLFDKDGKPYSLDAIQEGDQFFIIFADLTNGEETYGAGRFLYTAQPDSNGRVVLDFNKAYNPPCAFTPYATCPLPPKQNYLNMKVTAGEKKYEHY